MIRAKHVPRDLPVGGFLDRFCSIKRSNLPLVDRGAVDTELVGQLSVAADKANGVRKGGFGGHWHWTVSDTNHSCQDILTETNAGPLMTMPS